MGSRVVKSFVDENPQREAHQKQVVEAVNAREGSVVDFKTPATADQEFPVLHGLGRKPEEFLVLSQDAGGVLYRSRPDRWDARIVYLKYSGTSDNMRVRFR